MKLIPTTQTLRLYKSLTQTIKALLSTDGVTSQRLNHPLPYLVELRANLEDNYDFEMQTGGGGVSAPQSDITP